MDFCIVCKIVPNNPYKCKCQVNYCRDCYTAVNQTCVDCKFPNRAELNHELKNRILACNKCENNILNDDGFVKRHNAVCEGLSRRCNACNFLGKGQELSLHLYKEHYFQILKFVGEANFRIRR